MTAPIPAARPSLYLYVVVDTSTPKPHKPVSAQLSRREARDFIRWRKDADVLRVRRARAVIYDR